MNDWLAVVARSVAGHQDQAIQALNLHLLLLLQRGLPADWTERFLED